MLLQYAKEVAALNKNCSLCTTKALNMSVDQNDCIRFFKIGDTELVPNCWIEEKDQLTAPKIQTYELKHNKIVEYSSSYGSITGPDAVTAKPDEIVNNFDPKLWKMLSFKASNGKKLNIKQLAEIYNTACEIKEGS